jgi:hypothetical protein
MAIDTVIHALGLAWLIDYLPNSTDGLFRSGEIVAVGFIASAYLVRFIHWGLDLSVRPARRFHIAVLAYTIGFAAAFIVMEAALSPNYGPLLAGLRNLLALSALAVLICGLIALFAS